MSIGMQVPLCVWETLNPAAEIGGGVDFHGN